MSPKKEKDRISRSLRLNNYELLTTKHLMQGSKYENIYKRNGITPKHKATISNSEPSSIIAYSLYNVNRISYAIQNQCKINHIRQQPKDTFDQKHTDNSIEQLINSCMNSNSRNEVLKFDFAHPIQPNISFKCDIYYPIHFKALRAMYNINENNFIESLWQCTQYHINGGKKGNFCKTIDNKYLLKFIKLDEFKMFLDIFPLLFEYMANTLHNETTSSLVPLFGCYGINLTESNEHSSMQYILVMPHLFYGINEDKLLKFDLKGTVNKKRYVKCNKSVKLDQNFIEYTNNLPVILNEESIKYLNNAIENDTSFLCSANIMDYSFLVGINNENNIIIGGIIDYLEIYSWKKATEKTFKSLYIKDSTIQKPLNYKERFQNSILNKYFTTVPKIINNNKNINENKLKNMDEMCVQCDLKTIRQNSMSLVLNHSAMKYLVTRLPYTIMFKLYYKVNNKILIITINANETKNVMLLAWKNALNIIDEKDLKQIESINCVTSDGYYSCVLLFQNNNNKWLLSYRKNEILIRYRFHKIFKGAKRKRVCLAIKNGLLSNNTHLNIKKHKYKSIIYIFIVFLLVCLVFVIQIF